MTSPPSSSMVTTGSSAADRRGVGGSAATALLDRVAGRGLVIVLRDAHRHPDQRQLASALLARRPDAVLVEMGLPVWRPEGAVHVATHGAADANARALAEVLGLVRVP